MWFSKQAHEDLTMTTLTAERILGSGLDETLASVPGYLTDWAPNHRELDDAQRVEAGHYIAAILAHDISSGKLTIEQAETAALAAWRRFRTTYDDLVGPYSKGPRGDFPLAMRKI